MKTPWLAALLSVVGVLLLVLFVLLGDLSYREIWVEPPLLFVAVVSSAAGYVYLGLTRKKIARQAALAVAGLIGAHVSLLAARGVASGAYFEYDFLGGIGELGYVPLYAWTLLSWPLVLIAAGLFFGVPVLAARDSWRLATQQNASALPTDPAVMRRTETQSRLPWLAAFLSVAGILLWVLYFLFMVTTEGTITVGVRSVVISALAYLLTALGYVYIGLAQGRLLKKMLLVVVALAVAIGCGVVAVVLALSGWELDPPPVAWALLLLAAGLFFITPVVVAIDAFRLAIDHNRNVDLVLSGNSAGTG